MMYGPQGDRAKLEFLQELRNNQNFVQDRWLIVGDFNLILQANDKRSNGNLNTRMMGAFTSIVNSFELKELNLCGRKFTW